MLTATAVEPPLTPPTLAVGGFRLRPIRAADAAAWHAYLSDPRVIEHTSYPVLDLDAVRGLVAHQLAGYANATGCRWALADDDDTLVGTCGFSNWSAPHAHAELVYDLHPARWGRGIMHAAVEQVLGWGFDVAGFRRVHAYVMSTNARSARLLGSLAFHKEGTLRAFRIARGVARDFDLYARLRDG